jgi:hypothetical protein
VELEAGVAVSRYDLEALLAGTIIPFLFGWVAPVRPSSIISLMHGAYQVRGAPCVLPSCVLAKPR